MDKELGNRPAGAAYNHTSGSKSSQINNNSLSSVNGALSDRRGFVIRNGKQLASAGSTHSGYERTHNNASANSASANSTSANNASANSASAKSASVRSASVHSALVYSASVYSALVDSASAHSTSVHSASVNSASVNNALRRQS